MELSYTDRPVSKIDKKLLLLIIFVTVSATFTLWEFPLYFIGGTVAIIFLAGVYNFPELGIAVLVNGLGVIAYFGRELGVIGFVIPALVVLYTPALIHYVLNHKLRWEFGIMPGLVFFIGAMLFIGTLYSPMPYQGLVKAGKYLAINLFVFFATMLFINDINRLKNLLRIIAVLGFVTATISIGYITYAGIGSVARFALPSQNPIWFARDLGISLLATLYLFEISKKKLEKSIYIFFVLIMVFLIYIAGSRGPFLALLVSLCFYFFLLQGKGFNSLKKSFFILLTLLALKLSITVAPEHIWNRMLNLFSRFDLTTFYRLRAFETAKDLFFENPIKGVGTAGFGNFSVLAYPHNIVLELVSELGILAGLAFIGLVVSAAYLGIKLLRNKKVSFLELNSNKTFFAIFIFALINSQVSGAVHGNYQLWFAIAGIWTLYCSQFKCLKTR